MRVVHFSTSDPSGRGGGGLAAYRIHRALRRANVDSHMLVATKTSSDEHVVELGGRNRAYLVKWLLSRLFYRTFRRAFNIRTAFHADFCGTLAGRWSSYVRGADVIHLHGVAHFLTSRQIRRIAEMSKAPLVWTLMDLAPLTGGCHYTGGCLGYTQRCGSCPQIQSSREKDLSRWTWQRKAKNFEGLPLTIVGPTQWVVDRVKESSLFSQSHAVRIPLPVDTEIFRPIDQSLARETLRLPQDKRLILFGATSLSDERKGIRYLLEAFQHLYARLQEAADLSSAHVALAVAGQGKVDDGDRPPFESCHLGLLKSERELAFAYQAADLFVCPSIEDAGPMMIPEAMLCGTPVIAFDTGGAPDLVTTMKTGYLARLKDTADLGNGMHELLTKASLPEMRVACRKTAVRSLSPAKVAAEYSQLYQAITG